MELLKLADVCDIPKMESNIDSTQKCFSILAHIPLITNSNKGKVQACFSQYWLYVLILHAFSVFGRFAVSELR